MRKSTRREFVRAGVGAGVGACVATAACGLGMGGGAVAGQVIAGEVSQGATGGAQGKGALRVKKGLVMDMLPSRLSYAERFKLAKDVGFEVVQAPTTADEHAAEEMKKAADAAGIRIDSVMNMDHWKYPLSSGDRAVAAKCMEGMRTSLRNAK